jgi:hypothetical protein
LIEAGRRDLNVVDGQCGAWLVTPEMRRQRVQPASPGPDTIFDFSMVFGERPARARVLRGKIAHHFYFYLL